MAQTVYYSNKAAGDAVLVVFDRQGFAGAWPVGQQCTIGRKPGMCDVSIPSPIVSRKHGEILLYGDRYIYRDLKSLNGTYVNNKFVQTNASGVPEPTELHNGDVLRFDYVCDGQHSPDMAIAILASGGKPYSGWSRLELDSSVAEICIGRGSASGLQIQDEAVSEKHASFFNSRKGWAIIDHRSTNGVYLNGKQISSPRYLEQFDVIRIADSYFVFLGDHLLYSDGEISGAPRQEAAPLPRTEAAPVVFTPPVVQPEPPVVHQPMVPPVQPERPPVQPETPPLRKPAAPAPRGTFPEGKLAIHIVERSVVQRFKKMLLLQDINLSVSNGEMVLILGGSGAGKTTFVNAVMGYEKAKGRILYNDTDIYEEYEQMKYEIGFVPQQDLLRSSDTVYDTLANAAEMKLPRHVKFSDRENRIVQVLEQFGLTREKNSLVSKLSGGQKKRLSIAVEYIANPSLFFLDEPDSGIDDIMGRGLMESLRAIADDGKIVMVITHSPERAADLFDKVIVLAKSTRDNCGHLAFFGSVEEAFEFFEVKAFRDIVRRINRPDENGEGLSDYYIDKFQALSQGGF